MSVTIGYDTFTAANGTLISGRPPDTGTSWSAGSGMTIEGDEACATAPGFFDCIFAPACSTPDVDVSLTFIVQAAFSNYLGLAVIDPVGGGMYSMWSYPDGSIQINRGLYDNPENTEGMGALHTTLTVGNTYVFRITYSVSGSTVTLRFFLNGIEDANSPKTDTTYTACKSGGIWGYLGATPGTSGVLVKDFTLVDPAASSFKPFSLPQLGFSPLSPLSGVH
jgi:hypothetical protein